MALLLESYVDRYALQLSTREGYHSDMSHQCKKQVQSFAREVVVTVVSIKGWTHGMMTTERGRDDKVPVAKYGASGDAGYE
jgi:hypothetical protein